MLFPISSFFLPSPPVSRQIDIQLDLPSAISLASLELSPNEHPSEALLESYGLTNNSFLDKALIACSSSSANTSVPLVRSYTPPQIPWEAGEDLLAPLPKTYPMKITLQKGLEKLIVIEDGSSLFKVLTDTTTPYIPIFPDTFPRLCFHVAIDMKRGRIINSFSEREFTDKRLQKLSEKLLEELRFQAKENAGEEIMQGDILLQFASTFENIAKQLMNQGAFL